MNVRYRRIATAVLAGALLCGSAACGAESGKPAADGAAAGGEVAAKKAEAAPADAVQRAVEKNKQLTAVAYTMKGEIPGEGPLEFDASMNMKPLGLQMKMNGEIEGEPQNLEIRITPDGMFMGSGKPDPDLGGKSWMKFPAQVLGAPGAGPLAALPRQVDQNPTEEVVGLATAKDLKKVGQETLGGVSTSHYTGTLTLAELRAGLAGGDAATVKRRENTLKGYESAGVEKLTMDLWIGADDLTQQFRTRGTSKKGPLDLTYTFKDHNKPVTVEAPPAAETASMGG